MIVNILAYAIEFSVQTVFLLAALWIMLKMQKLNYHVLPLIGAAALASGLDMIPLVGHYLAVGVLLFCIWKITQSEYVDVAFTVFVGYALMFGMNLCLLGSLLGDLRADARSADEPIAPDEALVADFESDRDPSAEPEPKPAPAIAAAPSAAEKQPAPASAVEAIVKDLKLKGLCRNATNSSLILHTGVRTYTLVFGEPLIVLTRQGKATVCFEALGLKTVGLKVNGKSTDIPL
jgi:hypothetical protein